MIWLLHGKSIFDINTYKTRSHSRNLTLEYVCTHYKNKSENYTVLYTKIKYNKIENILDLSIKTGLQRSNALLFFDEASIHSCLLQTAFIYYNNDVNCSLHFFKDAKVSLWCCNSRLRFIRLTSKELMICI